MHRWIELVLIVAIAIGGYLAWQSGQERGRLQRTFDRLARKAGDLEIGDPTWVHVRAIPTGEPLHFAWRVYLPANCPSAHIITGQGHNSINVSRSQPQEFIARVRFREDENGVLNVYSKFETGRYRMGVGDQALATLLRGRWNEVVAEQLGAGDLVAISPDRLITLLRLSLPADLQERAKTALSTHQPKELVPVFFELQLGTLATTTNP